ncbi:sulfotransferase [Candidatus Parabeggiatoa sp. HSG14]|uniref:sulfotransferase family protein n=1 Tax=Candidatus Parabeggiatoa sp. HSG14 TaxID=3055593 RepID=UPI0025A802D3|nr:sulfotransferase [Thiotrichales bacterium HSG14]
MTTKKFFKKGLIKINNGFVYIDRLFIAKAIEKIPPPLFIVGVPRSGTTLTYQMITQQFQVGYFTAIMGYLYGMSNLINRFTRPLLGRTAPLFKSNYGNIKGILSPSEHANYWFQWFPSDSDLGHYVKPDKINLQDYESLKRSIESITVIMQKPMVFKCLYLDMTVGTLAQIFPDARFIFVRREHFMTCQSILLGRFKRKNPEQWWSVKPPHYKSLLSLPIWQQVTKQVFDTEKIILRDLKQYAPERYLELHYENICQNPQQIISDIITWLKPVGYKTYQNMRIPQQFTLSQKISLSETMVSQITEHLEMLKQQELP